MKPFPKADRGYIEVNVETWSEFHLYTNFFSENQIYIFRGQADSEWSLTTTLERYLCKFDRAFESTRNRDFYYRIQLRNFRDSLRGRGLKLDGMSDNELWALGQHYGLYTPLLDWTNSFYIALFFAFITEHEPVNGYRSVYALVSPYRGVVGKKINQYNEGKEPFQRFEVVMSKSEDNPRVITQAGLFTKLPFGFNLREWIQEDVNLNNRVFIKINIAETERRRVLKELNLMNINPKTMFPDLQGSSLNCNLELFLLADQFENFK